MVRDGRDGEIGALACCSQTNGDRERVVAQVRWDMDGDKQELCPGVISNSSLSEYHGQLDQFLGQFQDLEFWTVQTLERLGGSKFLHYSCKKWLNWSSVRVTECLNCGAPSRSDNAVFLCRAPAPAPAPHLSFGSGQSSRVIRGTRDHLRSSSAILCAH